MIINHTLLGTGDCTPIDRSSIGVAPLAIVSHWLGRIAGKEKETPLPFVPLSHFSAIAMVKDDVLTLSVYMPMYSFQEGCPSGDPVVTAMTVGVSKTAPSEDVWLALLNRFERNEYANNIARPDGPWCASGTHQVPARHSKENLDLLHTEGILKAFNQCLAWAWVLKDESLMSPGSNQWPWYERRATLRAELFPR